jgi:hypothetical protein
METVIKNALLVLDQHLNLVYLVQVFISQCRTVLVRIAYQDFMIQVLIALHVPVNVQLVSLALQTVLLVLLVINIHQQTQWLIASFHIT